MFDLIKLRIKHGKQYVPDIKKAEIKQKFRGLPILYNSKCNNCDKCVNICPTNSIKKEPLRIDLGSCIFCGECERYCENNAIKFTNYHKISSDNREKLIVGELNNPEEFHKNAIELNKKIRKLFKRSLKLRQVSAGGCNGCELELNACANPNFDMKRFGFDWVASPRHADGIVITGPITENMSKALEDAYYCTPKPKIIILAGTCAISGGLFKDSPAINRKFLEKYTPDLYIPGCPVHPLTFINGLLDFLGI